MFPRRVGGRSFHLVIKMGHSFFYESVRMGTIPGADEELGLRKMLLSQIDNPKRGFLVIDHDEGFLD